MNETKISFDQTVYRLNKVVVIMNTITTSILILQIFSNIIANVNNHHYNMIVIVFIYNLFFISTESVIFLRTELQDKLIFKITKWKINSLDINYKFRGTLKSFS